MRKTNDQQATSKKFIPIFFRKIGFPNILTSKVSFIYFKTFEP